MNDEYKSEELDTPEKRIARAREFFKRVFHSSATAKQFGEMPCEHFEGKKPFDYVRISEKNFREVEKQLRKYSHEIAPRPKPENPQP